LNNLSQADISEQQKHGNLNQTREISFPSTQEEKLKKQEKPSIPQLRIRPEKTKQVNKNSNKPSITSFEACSPPPLQRARTNLRTRRNDELEG
jgi:hypothetical protein